MASIELIAAGGRAPVVVAAGGEPWLELHEPFRVRLTGGGSAVGAYDSVRADGDGHLASGELTCPDGTRVAVEDAWSRVDGETLRVDRRVTVRAAGTAAGVRVELRAVTPAAAAPFDDWQLCVPGALYNRNDTDHDGREDYLGTYVQEYRDDRLPSLAVLAWLPGARRYVSLARSAPPRADSRLEAEDLLRRHIVTETDVGSLGLAPAGDRLELRAGHPFAEEHTFSLNTAGDGWAGYAANRDGLELRCSYLVRAGAADTLTEAIWDVTRRQMQTLGTAAPELAFTLEEALEQRLALTRSYYAESDQGAGPPAAGYAVHFSPRSGRTLGSLLEYGFSGAQTLLAYACIEDGLRSGRPEEIERACRVIDFFVERCQLPNGFSHGIFDTGKGEFVHWFTGILTPFQYAADEQDLRRYLGDRMTEALAPVAERLREKPGNYTRTMCESIYPLLLAYRSELGAGRPHPSWLEAGRRFGDFLLRTQEEDGAWYRAYSPDGEPLTAPEAWFGATDTERKSGTIFPVEVLVTLADLTGDDRYLAAAERAGDFVVRTYVDPVEYVGGLNDTTHIKSVKTDSVGVMFVVRSLRMLHERTGHERHLAGAVAAARLLASWVFLWDVPFPPGTQLAESGFRSTGWAVCDVIAAGGYVDNELLEFVGDVVAVAAAAGDETLFDLAEIVMHGMHGALSMPQDMLSYAAPGIQCEGVLTSYWLSDPEPTAFSGAASKLKGTDNDTCNGLTNGQAAYAIYELLDRYGTVDFGELRARLLPAGREARGEAALGS